MDWDWEEQVKVKELPSVTALGVMKIWGNEGEPNETKELTRHILGETFFYWILKTFSDVAFISYTNKNKIKIYTIVIKSYANSW